jgi:hypothetical protein
MLTITSPANGALVMAGQSLSTSVSASPTGAFSSVQVIGENIGLSQVLSGAPFNFSIAIPVDAIGPENITAVGLTPSGTVVFSSPITIDCEPAVSVTGLGPNLSQISFGFTGDQVGLTVQGKLSDGSSVDLTQSTNTSFLSGNIAVATVSSTGLVTAFGPGTATITVSNGGQIAAVSVSVPNSLRGDLNADGKIDADDVNILLSALNTKATGSFDARDLNGDGIIDTKDLQILAGLCTLAGCSTSVNTPSSPNIVLSPIAVSFGSQLVSTSSQAQTVTVVNSGAAALSITSIGTSGDFSETNSCSTSLAPEASCTINVVFSPTAAGLRGSSLSIAGNASGSPHVVGLSGDGTALTAPGVTVTPSASSITTTQALSVTVAVSGGTGNPTPTGSVTLTGGGYTSAATTLTAGSATIPISAGSLATGSDTLTVTYTPDASSSSTYSSATGSATVTVTTPAKTTPTVTATPSPSSITTAQNLSVNVTVSGGTGNPTPTGSVILTGGGYTSSTATLTSGYITFVIPAGSLAVGSDTLTVTYTPDGASSSTYNGASGTTTVSVTQAPAPSFSLTNSGGITVTRGATTGNTSVVTITPTGGFTGTVSLSCSIGPSVTVPPTCSVPASVTITGSTAVTATLTVNTTAASGSTALASPAKPTLLRAGVLAFAMFCFFGISARRRYARALFSLLFIAVVAAAVGCGGGSGSSGGGGGGGGSTVTTTGNYTITVTGTSGSLTATTPVSLTVN